MTLVSTTGAPRCPICAGTTAEVARLASFPVRRCDDCRHGFGSGPVGEPGDEQGVYATRAYHGFDEDVVFRGVVRTELSGTFHDLCPPPGRLLDVGCGNGMFVEEARGAGYEAVGIDTSPAAIELCAARGVPAHVATLADRSFGVDWDVVTAWDVVEHLRDPVGALSEVNALLRSGGALVVKVPTFGSRLEPWIAKVPIVVERAVHAPYHLTFFSETSLRLAFRRAGFRVVWFEVRGAMRSPGPPLTFWTAPKRRVGRATRAVAARGLRVRNLYVVARKHRPAW